VARIPERMASAKRLMTSPQASEQHTYDVRRSDAEVEG
jgi:hypothetical protein